MAPVVTSFLSPPPLILDVRPQARIAEDHEPHCPPSMDYHEIITIQPDKRSGKPCIRGTRMTVTDVLEYMAGGMTHQELLDEFPDLAEEDIRACLAFAADRERRLATFPA